MTKSTEAGSGNRPDINVDGASIEGTAVDVDKGQVAYEDKSVDPALRLTGGVVVEFTPEEEKSVLKNIDWHMLPLMCWVYMIQFADKTTLKYASLMGIQEDTKLVGNQYSWVSSIFYAGYLAWEYVVLSFPFPFPFPSPSLIGSRA
jgi:hypothetical protein